jgi:hypothetical protein
MSLLAFYASQTHQTADLRGADLRCMSIAMIEDEATDPVDVRLLGSIGVVFDAQC